MLDKRGYPELPARLCRSGGVSGSPCHAGMMKPLCWAVPKQCQITFSNASPIG